MEELLAAHRKQQRDLQSKITQKKKAASKKTRKGVNDECAALEQELRAKQEAEITALSSSSGEEPLTGGVGESEDASHGDNDDLLASIVEAVQPNSRPEDQLAKLEISPSDTSVSGADFERKPNRQKARLARRAAEQEAAAAGAAKEAAKLPDLRAKERTKMMEEFKKRGLQEKVVAANGHCLYLAVADQMKELGLDLKPVIKPAITNQNGEWTKPEDYRTVRGSAADYIARNPDDFTPFLDEPLEEYVRKIRDTGEWGGQLELAALAKSYGININVVQGEGRTEKIEGSTEPDSQDIWLAYYRHGFGLGEHYNSLRKAAKESTG